MSRLRALVALSTALVGLITIGAAFGIARTNHVYLGGLVWPFLSDLGRDPPASYVFFFGLNIVAVLLGLTWSFNHEYKSRFLQQSFENGQVSRLVCSLSYLSCLFGVMGAFGLPVFASFNAPPVMHNNAALGFLLCEAVAIALNTLLNYRIFLVKFYELDSGVFITDRYGPRSVSRIKVGELQAVKRGFITELACVVLFIMCVVVYVPVFYDVAKETHLTIAQCLQKHLGQNYCTSTMRLDDTYTTLWDYEQDLAVHQMRALAQLGCVLTLLGYTLSFLVDNTDEERVKDQDRAVATTLYYQRRASTSTTASLARSGSRKSRSGSGSSSGSSQNKTMLGSSTKRPSLP